MTQQFYDKFVSFTVGVFVGLAVVVCGVALILSILLSQKVEGIQNTVLNEVLEDELLVGSHRYSSGFYGQVILELNKAATRETLESLEYKHYVEEAKKINNDVVGWISVPDFGIDYPVLYSTDNKMYLRTDLNGEYDVHGSIYLDAYYGNIYSPTKLIHGHNMRDGSMFASLPALLKADTLDNAPTILYYDDLGLKEFKIFSVFSVNSEEEEVLVSEYSSLAELTELKQSYADRSWSPCSEIPDGLELLMLNTCWYGESGQEHHLHCIVTACRIK